MKKRFTEEQIIQCLKRLEGGQDMKTLCREIGVHMQTIYAWKKKFGGMEVSDAKRLKALEAENQKLKRMVANLAMDIEDLKYINSKNW
jgi:putative transposase